MRTIHCPKDIGLTNIFEGKDCEMEQRYDDCYHCWSSAIARNNQEYLQRKLREKGMSKHREPSEPHDVSFEELEVVEKLLKAKKLTEKQKQAIKSLVKFYFSTTD